MKAFLQLVNLVFQVLLQRNLRTPDSSGRPTHTIPPAPHPTEVIQDAYEEETGQQLGESAEVPSVPPAAEEPEDGGGYTPISEEAAPPQILVPKFQVDPYPGEAGHIVRSLVEAGYGPVRQDGRMSVVAIRNSHRDFDVFRCRMAHIEFFDGEWRLLGSWPATTYPGHHYTVDKLLNKAGAAILKEGPYRDVYRLDLHRGIYQALCQRGGPVKVYRDGNRNRVYDLVPSTIQSGMFGINCHATQNPDGAPANLVVSRVHAASAGCLVFARIADFVDARLDWRTAAAKGHKSPDLFLIESEKLAEPGSIDLSPAVPQKDDDEKAWFPVGVPMTTGIRNRNLLNVKGDDKWKYSLDRDSRGHHIFPSFPKGLRAGIINLRSYWTRHGLTNIAAILSRWAPSTDTIGSIPGAPPNSPEKYSRFVAQKVGVSPTDTLMVFHKDGTVRSADQLFLLVSAMVAYENSSSLVLPRSVFDEALGLVD